MKLKNKKNIRKKYNVNVLDYYYWDLPIYWHININIYIIIISIISIIANSHHLLHFKSVVCPTPPPRLHKKSIDFRIDILPMYVKSMAEDDDFLRKMSKSFIMPIVDAHPLKGTDTHHTASKWRRR